MQADAELVDDGVEVHTSHESPNALMAINSSEINQQIATAKKYPRSIKEFVREATEMVTMNQEVASECMYSLKRRGDDGMKVIEGPSARMAEIIVSAWGNAHAGARVIDEDDRFVTSQGAFFDMQRNVRITYEVRRRITTKNGKKFGDDMVGVTANAACSIALRNAILKGVPKAFWQQIYLAARKCAIGDTKTLTTRRSDMLAAFDKMGVDKEKVFAYLEVKGIEDVTLDHLALMIGVFQAIRNGEANVDETFNSVPQTGGKVAESDLNEKLKGSKSETKPEAETKEQPPNNDAQSPDDDALFKYSVMLDECSLIMQAEQIAAKIEADAGLTDQQKIDGGVMVAKRKKQLAVPGAKGKKDEKLFDTHKNQGQ